jgi:hypothetical protein
MKIRKQYDSVALEKESAYAERNGLKQQCTAAIRDLAKVTQQRDEMIKEAHKFNSEYTQKVLKLHKECEEAKQDQYLVLSERDNVENLLVRQVLCTSRTSRAWQFHTPAYYPKLPAESALNTRNWYWYIYVQSTCTGYVPSNLQIFFQIFYLPCKSCCNFSICFFNFSV